MENILIKKFGAVASSLFYTNLIDKAVYKYKIENTEVELITEEDVLDDITIITSDDTDLLGKIHQELLTLDKDSKLL